MAVSSDTTASTLVTDTDETIFIPSIYFGTSEAWLRRVFVMADETAISWINQIAEVVECWQGEK